MTYYVDNTPGVGNDSNNGTSTATPWATVNKVNTVTLAAGDTILFKVGQVWNETITPQASGTSTNKITYGSYGTGANPLFSGFDTLTSWTDNHDGTWSCTDTNLTTGVLNMVTINGTVQPVGRFPKTGYNTYTAHSGNASITDLTLSNTPSFVGATVVIRKTHWITDRGAVTAQSSGVISYTSETGATNYNPSDGYGYFFQNHANCLSQFGDWYYNASTHTITMYFGAASPLSYTIKAARLDTMINIPVAKTYLNFTNLSIEGGNKYGANAINNSNTHTYTGCSFNNIGITGIYYLNGYTLTVQNSAITNCLNNGITNVNAIGAIYQNNTVNNIHLFAGMGQSGDGNGIGIYVSGANPLYNSNNLVKANTVTNIGYAGIYAGGDTFTVQNNYIDTFALVKDDVGGIYTFVGGTYSYTMRTISNNIVTNGIGATAGAPMPVVSGAHGIYLDNGSSQVLVTANTVSDCQGAGLNTNDNQACTYTYNTFINCGKGGWAFGQVRFSATDSYGGLLPVNSLVFTNNRLVQGNVNQMMMVFTNNKTAGLIGDFAGWGTFNYNILCNLFNTKLTYNIKYELASFFPGYNVSLASWQTISGFEMNSIIKAPAALQPNGYALGTNIFTQTFDTSGSITPGSAAGTVQGHTNASISWVSGVLDGGSALITQTTSTSYAALYINCGNISNTKTYVLTFTSLATFTGIIEVYFSNNGASSNDYNLFEYDPVRTSRKEHVLLLTSLNNTTNEVITFKILPTYPGDLNIDNVILSEANVFPG